MGKAPQLENMASPEQELKWIDNKLGDGFRRATSAPVETADQAVQKIMNANSVNMQERAQIADEFTSLMVELFDAHNVLDTLGTKNRDTLERLLWQLAFVYVVDGQGRARVYGETFVEEFENRFY